MARQLISSGGKWEPLVGYSRAVKVGNLVFVSGCTASTPDGLVGKGDVAAQTRQCILTIRAALEKAGAGLKDVVKSRIYLTNIADWEQVGKVHGEFFGEIRPALVLVEISKLIDPDMLIEIEADAVIE
jgi:reactive intermediate/imine deaminase